MASSTISEVMPSDDHYRKFVTDTFQEYALSKLEDSILWGAINMDFENWTKENCERLNGNSWSIIRKCCIPRGVWIDEPGDNGTRSEILLKLVSTKHDTELKDWDINRIQEVEESYDNISRGIGRRKRKLLGNIPDEPTALATRSFDKPLTALDVGRYNIRNRRNDHQSAPTPVSNPVPYRPTSKIRDDCKCIPKRSTAPTLPTQALPIQAPPVQTPRCKHPRHQHPQH